MSKKRVGAFLILGLLAIVFVVGVVSAATPLETLKSFFSGSAENFKVYSAQFLFLLLVTLIVFAISEAIPFLENAKPWIRFSISVIIGILSIAYLAPEEVYTAMMGYESLGIILTTIIPLIVLMVVTIQWNTKHAEYAFFSQIIWIGFLVAYLVKYSQSLWEWISTGETNIGLFGLLFVAITGITSLIMVIAGGWISRAIFMKRLKGLMIKGKLNTELEITGKINTLRSYALNTPEMAEYYNDMIKELEKAQRKIRQSGT